MSDRVPLRARLRARLRALTAEDQIEIRREVRSRLLELRALLDHSYGRRRARWAKLPRPEVLTLFARLCVRDRSTVSGWRDPSVMCWALRHELRGRRTDYIRLLAEQRLRAVCAQKLRRLIRDDAELAFSLGATSGGRLFPDLEAFRASPAADRWRAALRQGGPFWVGGEIEIA